MINAKNLWQDAGRIGHAISEDVGRRRAMQGDGRSLYS